MSVYCYFPKTEWDTIRRAEIADEEGLRIRKHYTDIYSKNFLNENQDMEKTFYEQEAEDGGMRNSDREVLCLVTVSGSSQPFSTATARNAVP